MYNEDYLILLARDPNCLYAYWELSSRTQSSVSSSFGSDLERYILRVYDLTGLDLSNFAYHGYFDIELRPLTDNYFINTVGSNRSYCVELGCYKPEGDFVGIIRSNAINTPRNSMANSSCPLSSGLTMKENAKQSFLIGTFATLGIYGDSNHNAE